MKKKKIKVAVGLSGGVDSAVTAALLKEKGYDVCGITMAIYDGNMQYPKGGNHACYGPGEKEDIEIAASVCSNLNIPFQVLNLKEEYKSIVLNYFRNEYLAGRTPNPCIICNQKLKFGFLLDKARKAGVAFDYFATGHYARIVKEGDHCLLKRPVDRSKDQTYFLYGLKQIQLKTLQFPLGEYSKSQVREIANDEKLQIANRPESQDFIDGRDYSVLFDKDEIREGDIVDEQGNILGRHKGIIYYTKGQRKGLGISANRPLYVINIDEKKNRVVVSERENIFSKGLIASNLNFSTLDVLDRTYAIKAKIRLTHLAADATISPTTSGKAKIYFSHPQFSVTPGQSVVFYRNDTVFGGGIIEKPIKAPAESD